MTSHVSNFRLSLNSFAANQLFLKTDILVFGVFWSTALCLGPHTWLWVTGLVIGAAGFALWMVARRQLGASFMIGVAAKQLVKTGLYRRFRHPIYLFGGLAHFGMLVALQNWWLLLIWLAYFAPIQWARLSREDQVLEAEFGEEFTQLRSKTWI